jgi:diguanylate cyclase (GGDEF)-like protein
MIRRALVVDDEPHVRSMLAEILKERGLEVVQISGAEEALDLYRRDPFEVVIADVHMGGRSGIEMVKEIRRYDADATVVVLTGDPSSGTASRALESGAYDYLVKPFVSPDLIGAAVDRAMERILLSERNKALLDQAQRNSDVLDALNAKLTDIVNRDPLTGLYSHRFFLEALGLELSRAKRHDRNCALLVADVDDFRLYNETHGHLTGDELLRTVARLLQARSRVSTVSARFGADEFALLVPEIPPAGALTFAEMLGRTVEEHPFAGGDSQPEGRVTLSFGVAVYPEAGENAVQLARNATKALHRARQSGRNSVCVWQDSGD